MPIYNWNAIFLGNAPDIDPDESDITAANAGAILGTYGSAASPLYNNIVDVVVDDADGDTSINTNNDDFPSPDPISFDGVSKTLDSGAVYNVTITYTDGTTATITGVVMQTTDGDLYLAPEMTANADKDAMEAKAIESISLDSVAINTTNLAADRQQTNFVCFTAGTLIATPEGDCPVESLSTGQLVETLDRGPQPIRWIGSRQISAEQQLAFAGAAPALIPENSFGPTLPYRDLRLSQQHRIMLQSPVAGRMFGQTQVLCAVTRLKDMGEIHIDTDFQPVNYVHFACDRHEIVFANGLPVETLYPGTQLWQLLGAYAYVEYAQSGANMAGATAADGKTPSARLIIEGRRVRHFLQRLRGRAARRGAASPLHGLASAQRIPAD